MQRNGIAFLAIALSLATALASYGQESGTPRRSLAVLGFKNLREDKDTDWVGAVTAETLTTKLAAVKSMRVIERAQINRIVEEQNFQQTDLADAQTAVKLGRLTGAQSAVVGSFVVAGAQVRFNARIVDVESAEVLNAATLSGRMDDVIDLPVQLADAVIASLSKKVVVVQGEPQVEQTAPVILTEAERRRLAQRPTENPEAYSAYGRGVALDDKSRWPEAQQAFEKAVRLDPNFAMAWVHLGRMYHNQGEWPKALDAYRRAEGLLRAVGDEPHLAWVLNNLGVIRHDQGDAAAAMKCYQDSLAISRRLGEDGAVAQTLANIGSHLCSQGRFDDTMPYLAESLAISRRIGDEPGVALALNPIGCLHGQQGRLDKAMACFQESLQISRKLGDDANVAKALGNMGNVHVAQKRWAEAIRRFEECLAFYRRLGSRSDVAQTLYNLASAYATGMKEPAKALPIAREAAETAHRLTLPDAADYDELVAEISRQARR